jgi:hypothetical protein
LMCTYDTYIQPEINEIMSRKDFILVFFYSRLSNIFGYQAAVTITGLDLCLALTTFISEGSFKCHTYCDTGPQIIQSHPQDRSVSPIFEFKLTT